MNSVDYFRSLSQELVALRDRVRHFIGDRHWLTDGEWKESVLRNFLRRSLSSTVQVGKGFVLSKSEPSKQIDLLIYDSSKPVLFRDGDVVFVTPDAVRGIVEVKTRLNNSSYVDCVGKLTENLEFVRRNRGHAFGGIFAYESTVSDQIALQCLQKGANGHDRSAIRIVCLGEDTFAHYWYLDPIRGNMPVRRWHLYRMSKLSFGYFLHNCIEYSDPHAMSDSKEIWFPPEGKEMHKIGEAGLNLSEPPSIEGI